MNMSQNTKNNNNLDCPYSITSYNFKFEQCDLIPNFTLYNYKDIKLNIICDNGYSDNIMNILIILKQFLVILLNVWLIIGIMN